MSEILFQYYRVNPTTWVYLSSLMMIGLYFKFGRFWSVRNLDLALLILLAPGLLTAQYGGETRVKALQLKELEQQAAEQERAKSAAAQISTPEEWENEPWSEIDGQPAAPADPDELPHEEMAGSLAADGTLPTEELESAPQPESPKVEMPEENGGESSTSTASPKVANTPSKELYARSQKFERLGFLWLFAVGIAWFVRMLLDPTMVRRPLLEPNLTSGGLVFSGVSLFLFLMANVWTSMPPGQEMEPDEVVVALDAAADRAMDGLAPDSEPTTERTGERDQIGNGNTVRPRAGYALLNLIPSVPTAPLVPDAVSAAPTAQTYLIVAKVITILCHLAVVLGIVAIGYWHFGNTKAGVGVATLYLLLPYTAQMTGRIDHVLPAALLVWAILCYRRPLTAGMFIGLATSLVYYPLFLLPLWISFYWRRGLMRFIIGVVGVLVVMAISLVFIPEASYWANLQQMFGLWLPHQEGLEGIWGLGWNPVYRIPVLAAFVAMSCTLAIWPAQKNLGTLLSCSAAVMIATQFWHGYGGGLYMGWYLPLALLTVFRPNLEDRVALAVLGEGWGPRQASTLISGIKAA